MDEAGKTNAAWREILKNRTDLVEAVGSGCVYELSAREIKVYREPRLMTKFDTASQVAKPLQKLGVNLLANSRGTYVLGDFNVFERLPSVAHVRPKRISLPELETLHVDDITSESNAINALKLSGALGDFLGEDDLVETFNGRMGTGDFTLAVEMRCGGSRTIDVHRAQLEIDGGFESSSSVVIMEAKNVYHDDFNVRQLYYPFRRYNALVKKPVRLVFSQYTNLTYHLYEYEFEDLGSISSIRCVKTGVYSFVKSVPSAAELALICEAVHVRTDDNMDVVAVPFVQADRFDRIISIAERLMVADGLTPVEIAEFAGLEPRQGYYYSAAGEYVGLLKRESGICRLSTNGQRIMALDYYDRVVEIAKLMCEHEVFHRFLPEALLASELPSKNSIADAMRELHVCNDTKEMPGRRASTVRGWIRWVLNAIDVSSD